MERAIATFHLRASAFQQRSAKAIAAARTAAKKNLIQVLLTENSRSVAREVVAAGKWTRAPERSRD
jgi:ribosomal protein S5